MVAGRVPFNLDYKPMSARGLYVAGSILFFVVALVGFGALFEHFAGIMGAEWLKNIFPFGLALNPLALLGITLIALFISWLLLKVAKAQ